MVSSYWLLSTGETWRLTPHEDGAIVVVNETTGKFVTVEKSTWAVREELEMEEQNSRERVRYEKRVL